MSDEAAPRAHVRSPETDEVLRRIGRNVLNLQQVEYLLKFLITHSELVGPTRDLSARFETQVAAVQKKTMGELAGRLVDNVLQPQPEQEAPVGIEEIWMGFRFSIGTDAEFVDRHDREMRALIDARNDLVHHFLPRWQAAVDGDTLSALAYLDAQRDETMRMMERLQGWARSLEAGTKELASYWASPEGERQMELAFLRGSRLVAMLGEIAMRMARSDGWALLSTAGNLVKREAPAELEHLRNRFGHSTLKGVLVATELFDVAEEPTSNGGARTVYRINERYELHHQRGPTAMGPEHEDVKSAQKALGILSPATLGKKTG